MTQRFSETEAELQASLGDLGEQLGRTLPAAKTSSPAGLRQAQNTASLSNQHRQREKLKFRGIIIKEGRRLRRFLFND